MLRPLALLSLALASCARVEPATLGSSDPCADAPDPAADLLTSTAIDDFSVDGETAYVSVRTDPRLLENILYRVSIIAGARTPAVEIARPRSANRIAVTATHLYYEELASGAQVTRLLFRIPKTGGTPERVTLPSDDAPPFIETGLAADALGNVLAVRSFGGFYGLIRAAPGGAAVRVDVEPAPADGATRSVSGPFVAERGEVIALASRSERGSSQSQISVLGFPLDPAQPPRTIYGPDPNVVSIGTDEANVYVGIVGAVVVVPKDGGPHVTLPLPTGDRPFGMVVAGGYVYADFQSVSPPIVAGLGRLSIKGGAVERVSEEQPKKTVAAGCYVLWSTNSGLYARRR